MRNYKSLFHTRWDCKYHVVFIPKKRQKLIYGAIRKHVGATFHELAQRKGITIEEGHLMKDHVHMCISVLPKYSVSNVVGYIKGKSAISITENFGEDGETSMVNIFGQGDTSSQQSALMKKLFLNA